jgi:SPP1 gp7 family putative phage head morphogenesis protein
LPTVIELAQQFRAAIDKQDAAALGRLARTYAQLYGRMQGKLDSLLLAINKLDAPTKGQVFRLSQYKSLVKALESELSSFGTYTKIEIQNNSSAAIEMALKQTEAYLRAAGYSMPRSLPARAIYTMLGFLQEDSPLFKRIQALAPYHSQKVADALLEAVSFGYNPAKTAKMFENVMGGGLTDAMRMARTSQMYASREASRASYVANADVVIGWEWWSSLDSDVCMACAIEHGTIHELDEPMSSHYNCRCTDVPVILGYNDQDQKGMDWFNSLPESKQREMMGGQTYDAWKAGMFDLADMVGTQHDDVYGDMVGTRSLTDLLGGDVPSRP